MTELGIGAPADKNWKKYSEYSCAVDPEQGDKAKQIQLLNISRPHMRAFYCCCWGFFNACFMWFAVAPMLPQIRSSLNLDDKAVWTSSISSVGGTLLMRIILGPLCDKFGPRILFAAVLCGASIPVFCTGLVQSGLGLAFLRFFIGFSGGVFVLCQGWNSLMFTEQSIGTAISAIAGLGNMASGLTQLVVGSALFPLFKKIFDGDAEKAWRTVSIIPATAAFCVGIFIYLGSEDTPQGNLSELRKHGMIENRSVKSSLKTAASNHNTWILWIQNACATGVELTMNNAVVLYFQDRFDQSTESAAAIASLVGWMAIGCLFGGYLSDKANAMFGMKGRVWVQSIVLLSQGTLLFVFANVESLGGSVVAFTFLSLLIQTSEGTTYSLVPLLDHKCTGSVSGIVSAGGNLGAIAFGFAFGRLTYTQAFAVVGACVIVSSFLGAFIHVRVYDDSKSCGEHTRTTELVVSPEHDVPSDTINRIDIDVLALHSNIKYIRQKAPTSLLMAVLKSNAYGHGLETLVPELRGKVDWFGANSVDEARRIRVLDADTPILVIGFNSWDHANLCNKIQGITYVVSSIGAIQALQRYAPGASFHLAVDTGLSRLGVSREDELEHIFQFLEDRSELPWTGLMTHLADAGNISDNTFTLAQLKRFQAIQTKAKAAAGTNRSLLTHAAATAATLVIPESHLGMVRIGIGLYGLFPSDAIRRSLEIDEFGVQTLHPILRWTSRIVHCNRCDAGAYIGYGCSHQVDQSTRLAVVPIGYHEGYDYALSNRAEVLIRGTRCRVLGSVYMNMTTVDISEVPDAVEGDEVVLIGKCAKDEISSYEIAGLCGASPYQVLSRIHEKMPRIVVNHTSSVP